MTITTSIKKLAFGLTLAAVLLAGGSAMANDTVKTNRFDPRSSTGTVRTYGNQDSTTLLDQLEYDSRTN